MIADANVREIANFRSETAVVNGVSLHYWIGGSPTGRPVLLWHGFLGTGYSWHKVMPLLAEAGFSILVPDMRGYGDSDKPAGDEGYDSRALAEEFRALVRQIEFGAGQPLLLAAHDMGAPPALLWAADYPEEVAGLLYMEVPVMLAEVLTKIITYTPEAMKKGSMWWWILPLAPDVLRRLIVGHEREFLTWFYEGATARPASIDPATIDEYLRSFSGVEGVLGAHGVYRAAFRTMDQTAALTLRKVKPPVIALGGDKSLGDKVQQMVAMVADSVEGHTLADCGHFIPEEQPQQVMTYISRLAEKAARREMSAAVEHPRPLLV
jgi:pimeloyl-ACP methyl ester carboxylesterase